MSLVLTSLYIKQYGRQSRVKSSQERPPGGTELSAPYDKDGRIKCILWMIEIINRFPGNNASSHRLIFLSMNILDRYITFLSNNGVHYTSSDLQLYATSAIILSSKCEERHFLPITSLLGLCSPSVPFSSLLASE